MIRSKRKPISGKEQPAFSMSVLPDELITEILTRLPGKQIGRCKCVCKPWRSIIGSRPFMEIYRKRKQGMLLCWPEEINLDDLEVGHRLRFFHCPLRRSMEPPEEFSSLSELEIMLEDYFQLPKRVTDLVNGLICVVEDENETPGSNRLTLHNICTGEKMGIPDPPCVCGTGSTYYLGYEPVRRIYKLLRLISGIRGEFQGVHIMSLRSPSDSLSTWRELDNDAAGLSNLHSFRGHLLKDQTTSPDDGMMCWIQTFSIKQCLLCFDLNRECFWVVEHPVAGHEIEMMNFASLTRAITRFNERLVIWFSSSCDDSRVISCYVQGDGEGKNWSVKCIEISKGSKESEGLAVEPGSLPFFLTLEMVMGNREGFAVEARSLPFFLSGGEMLIKNPDLSWSVSSFIRRYTQHTVEEDVLFLGKLPDGAPKLSHQYFSPFDGWGYFSPVTVLFSFRESNNLYQPLDDILSGSATM